MSLPKQAINLNFAQGQDTKTDPYQLAMGKFAVLQNRIFKKGGLLSKRNGYQSLTQLPDATSTLLTTLNGNLTAIGTRLRALSEASNLWSSQGTIQPASLSVLPLIRNGTNQSQADSVVAANGLVCTVYSDQDPASLGAKIYRYSVADSTTGQNFVAPTTIADADATLGTPRVFLLGNYFIIVYTNLVSATYHLKYIAVSTTTLTAAASADISTSYTPNATVAFDGAVLGNMLYLAWNGSAASGIKMATLSSTLSLSSSINPDAAHVATVVGMCVDTTTSTVWVIYYDSGAAKAWVLARDAQLNSILTATQIVASGTLKNLTGSATGGTLTALYEVQNAYSYDAAVPSNFVQSITCTQGGSVGSAGTVLRSVGLGSKSFLIGTTQYALFAYQSPYQPTYFLADTSGHVIGKLAYQNGGGYRTAGLPNVSVTGTTASVSYLFKDAITPVNKTTAPASGTQTAGVYAQTGVNLATFGIGGGVVSAEIGENLHLSGGFLWSYDGYSPVENGFHLYPDSIEAAWSATGGAIVAKPDGSTNTNAYWYVAVFEWTDNQGLIYRSAPSIPIPVTTTGTGTAGSIVVQGPYLRLTYKTANPVKITLYRWSVAQQVYYQVTSIAYSATNGQLFNKTTNDSWSFTDTLADASIIGNAIVYTNGGVVENTGGPACTSTFIFDDRLWVINAEDENLLGFSKQVIEQTPVEMSDLLTYFVAPNSSAQGASGPLLCGAQMDEKCILFKSSSIRWFNGKGPDSTGANNQYSEAALITTTVGCSNQNSIVYTPIGLLFEFKSPSGNQIWLLGRDLSTKYIGDEMEDYTQDATVRSALCVPGTNQVRFTLSSGYTIVFDYYYGQWGVFAGVPAISSTLYQGLHTYLDSAGRTFQEAPGTYVDGSSPVLESLTTGWISPGGLQGYVRAYWFFLLGTYLSPHKLSIQIAYDYNPNPVQRLTYTPSNFAGTYGNDSYGNGTYGGQSPYGGPSPIEQFRCAFKIQKCQAFQITITEIFDPSKNTDPGPGLTMSGLKFVFGVKKAWPRVAASQQIG